MVLNFNFALRLSSLVFVAVVAHSRIGGTKNWPKLLSSKKALENGTFEILFELHGHLIFLQFIYNSQQLNVKISQLDSP